MNDPTRLNETPQPYDGEAEGRNRPETWDDLTHATDRPTDVEPAPADPATVAEPFPGYSEGNFADEG